MRIAWIKKAGYRGNMLLVGFILLVAIFIFQLVRVVLNPSLITLDRIILLACTACVAVLAAITHSKTTQRRPQSSEPSSAGGEIDSSDGVALVEIRQVRSQCLGGPAHAAYSIEAVNEKGKKVVEEMMLYGFANEEPIIRLGAKPPPIRLPVFKVMNRAEEIRRDQRNRPKPQEV